MNFPAPPPRWLPIVLSATVYPGVGQFRQGRPVWGAVYALGFTLFMAIFFALLTPSLKQLVAALTGGPPADPVPWPTVLRPLAVAGALYAANVYDVWWNGVKAARRPPAIPPG